MRLRLVTHFLPPQQWSVSSQRRQAQSHSAATGHLLVVAGVPAVGASVGSQAFEPAAACRALRHLVLLAELRGLDRAPVALGGGPDGATEATLHPASPPC